MAIPKNSIMNRLIVLYISKWLKVFVLC